MGCGCGNSDLTDEQKKLLNALANNSEPCGSKDIAAATGLELKQVSSRISDLKKKGYVDSPIRCKYAITDEGKSVLEA